MTDIRTTFAEERAGTEKHETALSLGERFAWWIATGLASILMTVVQMTATEPFKLASLERLIHFEAYQPFQCRVLIPALAAGVQSLLPLGTELIFGTIQWLFWLALFVVAYRGLDWCGVGRSELVRRLLALSVVVPMSVQLLMPEIHIKTGLHWADGILELGQWGAWPLFYYPYDLPAAVLTLVLSLLLVRLRETPSRRLVGVFLGVFILATFNRETTIFLLPCAVLLLWHRWSTPRLALLMAAMTLLFFAVEIPLYWLFDQLPNPNRRIVTTQYENHFLENMGFLSNPLYVTLFLTRLAGGFVLIALFWWRFIDRPYQLVLIGFAMPLFVFGLWVGRLPEHRIFAEMVPLVWLAALQAIHRRARSGETPPGYR